MAEPLVVNLLGPPRFSQAKVPVTCASRKALGLFAYMLLSTRVHPRRELAALLWGRGDEETARASLRVALHRLPAPMAECLRVDRDSIELAAAPLIDVARFEALARAEDLASLEQATELYQGELLQDFEADATPEFDDWLHAQRTRIAQVAQQAFDGAIARRADRARQDGARATIERESALATGQRWATLMPGAEAAHRWLMQLYLDMGRRDAALAQYDMCQRFMAVNYGRAPSAQTRALYESALGRPAAAERAAGPHADAAGRPEPVARSLVPASSFVGRIEELAELDRLLADANCRLLTLHGLGGAGKTRLAHALATQVAGRFAQGVTWVALEAAESPDALPAAIASALGRELPPRGDRAELVAKMLAGQERLLVLDNLETLLAGEASAKDAGPSAVIGRILDDAPQVRILVTSRDVLGLQEEWVYDVHGLAHDPQAAERGSAPAVELFAQRARQAYIGFSLAAEMPHVLRICALVEGLPLGIELAAAWVRAIPCGDIAAAIERTVASLGSRHRNRAERHRNLDAVVAYSWDLLAGEQQHALAALSVFAGGFTREAAERVADATLRSLSVLVDKSLVRRRPEGRYGLHEIVRQFALARLEKRPPRHAAAMRRHAELFAEVAVKLAADMRGPGEAIADVTFATELPNLVVAFDRSVGARWRDVVSRMASPLAAMLFTRGRVPASYAVAERGVALLSDQAPDEVLALIHMHYGRAGLLAAADLAERELDMAVAIARRSGRPALLARCLYYRGALALERGALASADTIIGELMPLAVKTKEPELIALAHSYSGIIGNMRSQFAAAEEHLRKAVTAAREFGAPSLIAGALCGLAPPLYYQGKFDEAAAVNDEAAGIFAKLGRNTIVAMLRSNVAAVLLAKNDPAGAVPHARAAVDLARETGDRESLSCSLPNLADALLRLGQVSEARLVADEALHAAEAFGSTLHLTEVLFLLACVDLRDGRSADALEHIRKLRDRLAKTRLDVRVPMLIIATADWIASSDRASWPRARRWLEGLAGLGDIDATLRDRAKGLLAREGAADATGPSEPLAGIEADVLSYLASHPGASDHAAGGVV